MFIKNILYTFYILFQKISSSVKQTTKDSFFFKKKWKVEQKSEFMNKLKSKTTLLEQGSVWTSHWTECQVFMIIHEHRDSIFHENQDLTIKGSCWFLFNKMIKIKTIMRIRFYPLLRLGDHSKLSINIFSQVSNDCFWKSTEAENSKVQSILVKLTSSTSALTVPAIEPFQGWIEIILIRGSMSNSNEKARSIWKSTESNIHRKYNPFNTMKINRSQTPSSSRAALLRFWFLPLSHFKDELRSFEVGHRCFQSSFERKGAILLETSWSQGPKIHLMQRRSIEAKLQAAHEQQSWGHGSYSWVFQGWVAIENRASMSNSW